MADYYQKNIGFKGNDTTYDYKTFLMARNVRRLFNKFEVTKEDWFYPFLQETLDDFHKSFPEVTHCEIIFDDDSGKVGFVDTPGKPDYSFPFKIEDGKYRYTKRTPVSGEVPYKFEEMIVGPLKEYDIEPEIFYYDFWFSVSVSLKVATDSQEKCFHYIAN